MGNYLLDCEVEELVLRIPREHAKDLAAHFDGGHRDERAAARAVVEGAELRFESRGGRLVLVLEGEEFVASELEIFDDRSGEFFRLVVINLAMAYRGDLRCRLHWANPGSGLETDGAEVVVEAGRSNVKPSVPPAAWMAPRPTPTPEVADTLGEEIASKLAEARRHWDEYQRLKGQRESARR